jgi:ribosome biogenesis protein BMS1
LFKVKSASIRKKYLDVNELDSTRFRGDEGLLLTWKDELKSLLERKQQQKGSGGLTDEDDDDMDDDDVEGFDEDEEIEIEDNEEEDDDNDEEEHVFDHISEDYEDNFFTALRNRFVTGNWGKAGETTGEDAGEEFGAFEDMQTGEVHGLGEDEEEDEEERGNLAIDEQLRLANAKNKAGAKASFDSEYDQKKMVI